MRAKCRGTELCARFVVVLVVVVVVVIVVVVAVVAVTLRQVCWLAQLSLSKPATIALYSKGDCASEVCD